MFTQHKFSNRQRPSYCKSNRIVIAVELIEITWKFYKDYGAFWKVYGDAKLKKNTKKSVVFAPNIVRGTLKMRRTK